MVGNFLTPNKLKEIFDYCSEFELTTIQFEFPEFPEFSLGVPLRITDVN